MSEQWLGAYDTQAQIYEDFSKYEDAGNQALTRLLSLADFKGKTVLEMGCGSGKYTAQVASVAGKYYALDLLRPLLEIAGEKCKNLGRVNYINANVAHIPLSNQVF